MNATILPFIYGSRLKNVLFTNVSIQPNAFYNHVRRTLKITEPKFAVFYTDSRVKY